MSDRKYGQRGYQDSDRDRPAARKPQTPQERPPGPRGRGLGKPTATVFRCAVCGARQASDEIVFETVCTSCGKDVHTCTHCARFDTSVARECRDPRAEYVASKAKRNVCAFFTPKATQEFASESGRGSKPNDPRAAFDALFKI
jgi:hypothetical protein